MNDLFRNETTRRGFLGVVASAILSVLVIAFLWLVSRGAPSAGTDPGYVPPAAVPAADEDATP